jgi:hypothetical protein
MIIWYINNAVKVQISYHLRVAFFVVIIVVIVIFFKNNNKNPFQV